MAVGALKHGSRICVGIVGCGSVSRRYAATLGHFGNVELVSCADEVRDRAKDLAERTGMRYTGTTQDLLDDPSVELVVNLTPAHRHAEVSERVLDAGRALYTEKPLAPDLESARRLHEQAMAKGLLVGCAPDTVQGRAHQTCRRLIAEGAIGTPVLAFGAMLSHGHEAWHPRPEIFYKRGAGPLLDMGPYYASALVDLLGPARRVTGDVIFAEGGRSFWSGTRRGDRVELEVPTAASAVVQFDGAQATLSTSFESWATRVPRLEIHGTAGVLACPDPSLYRGVISIWTTSSRNWTDVPLDEGFSGWQGVGVADLAWCLVHGETPLASVDRALHVQEILCAVISSAESGCHISVESAFMPSLRRLDLAALGWDGHVPTTDY